MTVERDRLYDLMAERTGILRIRDSRLEAIAADRALEGRYAEGLVCVEPCEIQHPVSQLKARTFPIQGTLKGVWENTFWTYVATADPYLAALDAWWDSPAHHANLMRTEATHHGLGVYFEDVAGGNRRWYFIQVLTKQLLPHPDAKRVRLEAGQHYGYRFHDDGSIAKTKGAVLAEATSYSVDRRQVIRGEAFLHLKGGTFKEFWLPESSYRVEPATAPLT